MARKVFITVLGTGFYSNCKYVKNDFESSETRFIQQATLEFLKVTQWSETDATLFLLTPQAKTINWNKTIVERKHFSIDEKIPYKGLEKVLEEMNIPFSPTVIDIPEGKNEKEMWEIFNKLYKALEDYDELYFDLTHSFRYLPMLVLVFSNYAKFLKKAKVKHISYGNYEARDMETNKAPFIDLLPISGLQDWTFASADYLENGNATRLTNLCTSSLRPMLQNMKSANNDATLLNTFAKYLNLVIEERQTCRGIEIVKSENLKKLKSITNQLSTIIIEPLEPVIEKIKHSLDQFDERENVMNGFSAAFWCLDNGLYQQAVTIFHENIISYLCKQNNLDWKEVEQRECVNKALVFFAQNIKEDNWQLLSKKDKAEDRDTEINSKKKIITNLLSNNQLQLISKPFMKMNDIRNDFNHSGIKNNHMSVKSLKDKLVEAMNDIYNIVNK